MLAAEDLAAIRGIAETESARQMNIVIEKLISPQFRTLAEGQSVRLEKLAPRNRVEELEAEAEPLKSVIRLHSAEIAELKKAQ